MKSQKWYGLEKEKINYDASNKYLVCARVDCKVASRAVIRMAKKRGILYD